jgi:cation:H+ antiporter
MWTEAAAVLVGLALLVWSADRFVEGAAATANRLGMPPLLIGMVVIGFGTSAPEIVVSTFSALEGNPGLALGNAYGSNIANIALILGITALISPIAVHSQVLRRELPLLLAVTGLAWWLLADGGFSPFDAGLQLGLFGLLLGWSIWQGLRDRQDPLAEELADEIPTMEARVALFWLVSGLVLLVASSRLVVWGAVGIATEMGISDLVIGLTVVAIGTSLPELASSIAAARKGQHDLALGNVLGSNLFNTLLVAGIAGAIAPHQVAPELLQRDMPVLMGVTLALFFMGFGLRGRPGRINRLEGGLLMTFFVGYTGYLAASQL